MDVRFFGKAQIYLLSVCANFGDTNSFGYANGYNVKTLKNNTLLGKKCVCIIRDHQYSVSKQKTAEGHKYYVPKNYK